MKSINEFIGVANRVRPFLAQKLKRKVKQYHALFHLFSWLLLIMILLFTWRIFFNVYDNGLLRVKVSSELSKIRNFWLYNVYSTFSFLGHMSSVLNAWCDNDNLDRILLNDCLDEARVMQCVGPKGQPRSGQESLGK